MSRRRDIVAVIAGGCVALGGVTAETVTPAFAASTTGSATARRKADDECCNEPNSPAQSHAPACHA